MSFELGIIIHACIAGCETFALSYFFGKFLVRKYKNCFVYTTVSMSFR